MPLSRTGECRPYEQWNRAPGGSFCHLNLICQRCGRCSQHCTCPPPEMRQQVKEKANGRKKRMD